jgi:anti-sigma factor RsiW
MAHENDEDLSALIDGELSDVAAVRARAHTASCAECAARLDRLNAASFKFKRSGERPVPAGLAARVKDAVRPRRFAARPAGAAALAMGAVFAAGIVLIGGVALKRFMPALFDNIQQMISGAASSMGAGGK